MPEPLWSEETIKQDFDLASPTLPWPPRFTEEGFAVPTDEFMRFCVRYRLHVQRISSTPHRQGAAPMMIPVPSVLAEVHDSLRWSAVRAALRLHPYDRDQDFERADARAAYSKSIAERQQQHVEQRRLEWDASEERRERVALPPHVEWDE